MLNKKELHKYLSLLAKKIEFRGKGTYNLVVCGGASMIYTGFSAATTKDVDIIGIIDKRLTGNNSIKECTELPFVLKQMVFEIATDYGLPEDWLNTGPTALVQFGLPKGFSKRVHTEYFGDSLIIHFAGRYDLIHFKLYAAVDSGPGRHLKDLKILDPTDKEIEDASRWALTHDVSKGFRKVLVDMLDKLGYKNVAEKL